MDNTNAKNNRFNIRKRNLLIKNRDCIKKLHKISFQNEMEYEILSSKCDTYLSKILKKLYRVNVNWEL